MSAPDRRDNGLIAPSYVALTDLAVTVAPSVLTALGRARIAAYLAEATREDALRLYVASAERADARTIVESVVRASGADGQLSDPLTGIDSDAEFDRIVAGWHVDTHSAIRDAERDLTREDEDWRARLTPPPQDAEPAWLDEEHYVPPAPPPLPRFAARTVLAMLLIAASIVLFAFGRELGLTLQFSLLLGVAGVLAGTGILLTRLRSHPDDGDDGAVL